MYLVFVIAFDTAIQDGIGNGLDLVTVVVSTAQALRRQRVGRHKDHIGQMAKIVFAQFIPGRIDGKLQFFVAGNVRIAEQRAAVVMFIGGAGSVETVLRKECRKNRIAKGTLRRHLKCTGQYQLP